MQTEDGFVMHMLPFIIENTTTGRYDALNIRLKHEPWRDWDLIGQLQMIFGALHGQARTPVRLGKIGTSRPQARTKPRHVACTSKRPLQGKPSICGIDDLVAVGVRCPVPE